MKYWVYGKDSRTGQPREPIFLEVASAEDARAQATEAGMAVDEVEFVDPTAPLETGEDSKTAEEPQDSVQRTCPDCGGSMKAIELLDKTVHTLDFSMKVIGWNIPKQTALEYAVPQEKRSWWTSSLPIAGQVAACMCDRCGRILLYGRPQPSIQ